MVPSRARLTVDLDALAANHAALRAEARGAEVAVVVKADAYGLGLGPVARRLWAEGARSFFVARLEEGEALRQAGDIHVLDGATPGSPSRLAAAGLIPILNSPSQLETLSAWAHAHGDVPCGVHIDTGMNRLGFRPEELQALLAAPDRLNGLSVTLVMSHLACADTPDHPLNARQAAHFRKARTLFATARASLANTGGIFLGSPFRHDLVRAGIGLYGGGPLARPHPRLAPVATLEAPILDVRPVPAGETVGYGADFHAKHAYRAAIVAAGYADGLPRAAAVTGHAFFAGRPRRLLGRVSMDLIAIDVTGCEEAQPGALVELLGPNILVDDAAAAAGTVAYELLTRLGARLERCYQGAAG
jgi:alanine racemase